MTIVLIVIAVAVLGTIADTWSTKLVLEQGGGERNPFQRWIINKWGIWATVPVCFAIIAACTSALIMVSGGFAVALDTTSRWVWFPVAAGVVQAYFAYKNYNLYLTMRD